VVVGVFQESPSGFRSFKPSPSGFRSFKTSPSGFWSVPIVSQCFHVVFGVFQMSHAASSTFAHGHVQRPWPDRAHRHIRMIVSTISLSSKDHNWRMWCRDSKAVLINLNK
jgi:hypothetical protein